MTHMQQLKILAPNSKFYKGPYGRMFPNLAPWLPPNINDSSIEDHFLKLANNMKESEYSILDLARDRGKEGKLQTSYGSSTPAGYTYFGQFIDHDITFDPVSSLMRKNDPNGILNFRTPRLDLDCMYGGGMKVSPFLYTNDKTGRLLVDTRSEKFPFNIDFFDLQRNKEGIAIIGDPRNDENAIVCQLHLAFVLAHNTLVERAIAQGVRNPFDAARTTLSSLYQHIVWFDFLGRITINEIHDAALSYSTSNPRQQWTFGLSDIYEWKVNPFIPIEFSVAAYRFGHSMVRNSYQTNKKALAPLILTPVFDNGDFAGDLRGNQKLESRRLIQWDWFLEMNTSEDSFPQKARKIDTKLANALYALPDTSGHKSNLSFRNLMRGLSFDLPSGTDVARKLGFEPIEIDPDFDSLWYYILLESERTQGGERLGQVGSTIVCATIAGLLLGDPNSYINRRPDWSPDKDELLQADDKQDSQKWTLASIIRLSNQQSDDIGF